MSEPKRIHFKVLKEKEAKKAETRAKKLKMPEVPSIVQESTMDRHHDGAKGKKILVDIYIPVLLNKKVNNLSFKTSWLSFKYFMAELNLYVLSLSTAC